MLGEMELLNGDLSTLDGSVAFVPQKPWIVNDTVRGNIVFGNEFEDTRYARVIEACCLTPDLANMPGGDSTEIGERGINLSGGQKSRISLARAAYAKKDICLFDDLLAAVDVHVGKQLFDGVIKPTGKDALLGDATRVLITNQLHILSEVDHIIVMGKDDNGAGCVQAEGTYAEISVDVELAHLLPGDEADQAEEEDEQESSSSAIDAKEHIVATQDELGTEVQAKGDAKSELVDEEVIDEGVVSFDIYKRYAILAGGAYMVGAMLICVLLDECLRTAGNVWLAYWAGGMLDESYDTSLYLLVYFLLCLGQWVTHLVKGVVWVMACVKAARALHGNLLVRIIGAPLAFFDRTPVGRGDLPQREAERAVVQHVSLCDHIVRHGPLNDSHRQDARHDGTQRGGSRNDLQHGAVGAVSIRLVYVDDVRAEIQLRRAGPRIFHYHRTGSCCDHGRAASA